MNADRIRLGQVRAGENGTSHPAYRPPPSLELPRPIAEGWICRALPQSM